MSYLKYNEHFTSTPSSYFISARFYPAEVYRAQINFKHALAQFPSDHMYVMCTSTYTRIVKNIWLALYAYLCESGKLLTKLVTNCTRKQ